MNDKDRKKIVPANDADFSLPDLGGIMRYFGIEKYQSPAEETSICHVFRQVCLNPDNHQGERLARADKLADLIKQKIEFRRTNCLTYMDDFFQGEDFDRDALMMAVICDDFLTEPFYVNFPDDPEILKRAYGLWLDAAELEKDGMPYDEIPADRTTWFLVSINILEQLSDMEKNLDRAKTDDLVKAQKAFFGIAADIVDPDTAIGYKIIETMDRLDQAILLRRPAASVTVLYPAPLSPL